jgi:hypothetical protein
MIKIDKELVADMLEIGLSIDNYDGRLLLIFYMPALIRDCKNTFI